ncbi:purine and uridine phosphorylase, partial [Colletotrichum sublineola]
MSTTFHHDERRGITMPTERDSTNTREKRAWDSMKNHDDKTATLAKRTRLIASDLNKTDSPQHHTRIELSHEDYTVGWVCALPSEMAAAKAMLEAVHKPLSMNPNDTNQYVFGSIDHHNIVIVCLPSGQYGITRAAIVANNMRWSFPSISIRLMVGIGGGVPSKVDMRLGDVVVSCPTLSSPGVIQYDFGKTVNSGRFQVTGFLNKPPQDILGAVAKLRADHESQCSSIALILSEMVRRNPTMSAYTYRGTEQDRLYAATYDHVGETCEHCDPTELVYRNARPDNNPRIHYGTVASANQVMKHGLTRDRLAKNYDILCFEMEAAGLMDHFPCLVIRGICDYSDSHKAKQWQEYAAATAAAYAKELLSVIPPVQGAQSSQSRSNAPEASSTSPEERRESLIQSLRFGQIDSRYESIKAAHSKTCHWLLGHSDYLCWLDPDKMAEHHGFLWISGKPGAGKSTIMKYVFSQATKNATSDSAVISFFFNARGDHLERTVEGMYRSLLLQLLERFPVLQEVLDDVVPASIVHSSSGQFKVPMIQDLVLKTIAKLNRQAVTCFVDALDECDEQEVRDMLDFFVDLGHCAIQSDTKLYICFSSRHYPYMDIPHCQRFTLEDQTGHQEDIELYVNNKLQIGSKKQREDIKVQVLQKASGVFMWVVLVVDILNKEYKRGRIFAVKQRLSEIPPGLSELFRDILTRDQDNMDDFLLCIQWLLFGGRPLKREEYYFAMTAGLHPQDTEEITTEDMNLFVLSSSKGLAETATKSKKSIVQFIHESVRDFLLKDGGLKSLWPDIESDFAENSHERLKRCCCTYLQADVSAFLAENDYLENNSSEKVASIRQEVGDKFPFMDYAATQLFYHAEAAACTIEQNGFLLDFSDRIFRSWIPRRNLFVP